jgi:acyl-CoA thioesterase I
VQKPIHPRRFTLCRSAAALTRLAGAGLLVCAAASARGDELACPGAAAAFDANGATFALPTGGAGRPLDILAIGSSSTEGVGASSPSNAYPARLEDELSRESGIDADVKNAGVGGETAVKTLQRLKSALKSGWARLVIWQVGTNDAIVGVDEAAFRATLEGGVAAARAAGVQLLLIDPQFTLKSRDALRYERFVAIVDEVGARDHVPVLSRYAMMKRRGAKSAMALLSGDGLHMNDLGYRCVAHVLAEAIEGAAGAKL